MNLCYNMCSFFEGGRRKMKERISDEMYIAGASPILGISEEGRYRYGDVREYFIINPIMRKNVFGKEKIVGAVEAISKIKLFDYAYYTAEDDYAEYRDAEEEMDVGGIKWSANMYAQADKVLAKEILEQYFSQTPEEAAKRITDVRNSFKELAKARSFSFSRILK